MHLNFYGRYEETGHRYYLVKDPDNFGRGVDIGYYYEDLWGVYHAVALKPFYSDAEFSTEKEAKDWLRSKAK